MFSICIHGYTSEKIINYWSYVLSHWSPEKVYLLKADGKLITNEKKFVDAIHVATANELPTDQPLVLVQPLEARYISGDTSLHSFVHPANPIYLFGSNKLHFHEDDLGGRVPDHSVHIPPTDDNTEMHDFVAGAVILYDRAVKNG